MNRFSFACPQCQAKLQAQDAVVGRKVKCPKCQQVVLVPSPPSAGGPAHTPAVATASPGPAPLPSAKSAAAAPAAIGGSAAIPSGPAPSPVGSPFGSVPSPVLSPSDRAKVKSGLGLVDWGLKIALASVLFTVLGAIAMVFAALSAPGNDAPGMILVLIAGVGGLFSLGGAIVATVGDWKSARVAPESGVQGKALACAICMTAGVALLVISPCLGPAAAAPGGLASLAIFARNILFLLLLADVAAAIGDTAMRTRVRWFFIYWLGGGAGVVVAYVAIVAVVVTSVNPNNDGAILLGMAPGVILFVAYLIGLVVWLLKLIGDVRELCVPETPA